MTAYASQRTQTYVFGGKEKKTHRHINFFVTIFYELTLGCMFRMFFPGVICGIPAVQRLPTDKAGHSVIIILTSGPIKTSLGHFGDTAFGGFIVWPFFKTIDAMTLQEVDVFEFTELLS